MKNKNRTTQQVAAAKAGMDVKTARKYIKSDQLPSEVVAPQPRGIRANPFEQDWLEIVSFLENNPGLLAKTLFNYLNGKIPGPRYQASQLRTLQRHIKIWRSQNGSDKRIIFPQDIKPGLQSQSDWKALKPRKDHYTF